MDQFDGNIGGVAQQAAEFVDCVGMQDSALALSRGGYVSIKLYRMIKNNIPELALISLNLTENQ